MARLTVLLVSILALSTSASAQITIQPGTPTAIQPRGDRFVTSGVTTTRPLAGEAGESLTRMEGRGHEWIYGLEFGENSDEPCYLKVLWADASQGRNRVRTRSEEFNHCYWGSGTNRSLQYVGVPTSQVQGTSEPPRGIFKLRLETNGRNRDNVKVKAVYVQHGQVPTRYFEDESYFRRPNARSRTMATSDCGSNGFVVGLEIHHNTVSSLLFNNRVDREAITGIAVRCKRMVNLDL